MLWTLRWPTSRRAACILSRSMITRRPILKKIDDPVAGAKYSDRAGMRLEEFRSLAAQIAARADEVPAAQERVAAAARAAGVPMASHDDDSIATRTGFRARGARICEFPMAEEVGAEARAAGDWVVMGCPNVMRGGSHLGWASAARLAEAGICSVLSSDYFYPAMLRAALILAGRGVLDLSQAWGLISENPAAAAGLVRSWRDRGRVARGPCPGRSKCAVRGCDDSQRTHRVSRCRRCGQAVGCQHLSIKSTARH